jgi:tetratricopeptide (TPR) repeat protein
MKTIAVIAVFAFQPNYLGCLNSPMVSTSLNGATTLGTAMATNLTNAMLTDPLERRPKLSSRADPQDKAVVTILSGDHQRGIAILLELEHAQPGDYNTAANLGTAYELAGENEQALTWIKEGLKRNPNSHRGTEWLHVLILQAKLEEERGQGLSASERLVQLPQKGSPATAS